MWTATDEEPSGDVGGVEGPVWWKWGGVLVTWVETCVGS